MMNFRPDSVICISICENIGHNWKCFCDLPINREEEEEEEEGRGEEERCFQAQAAAIIHFFLKYKNVKL